MVEVSWGKVKEEHNNNIQSLSVKNNSKNFQRHKLHCHTTEIKRLNSNESNERFRKCFHNKPSIQEYTAERLQMKPDFMNHLYNYLQGSEFTVCAV